ncbi:MarR family transcriptional regulator [Vibrio sp. DW001]|uniref:MarR family winged helix-turn-helix transcriptional regulator n=1 Tax=Vibrio sp. DW001 TaxID=2912315 RepID=UPI0023B12990|nr:MarR family transcriptional regulator [Vibrio sp. DW001]WED28872.1 MarR family transcriptional regulator [Vibrio sp. DW001]
MSNDSISDTIFNMVHLCRLTMRSTLKASEIGLNSMHIRCLTFIEKNESCTANDIVNFFSRDKAQIARLIKEMIDKDWLSKSANPEDKRSQLLVLTEGGKALMKLVSETQSNMHNKMQENLSEQELTEFRRVADIISRNLRNV